MQRNYGNDYGELYKPDSMSFGCGRGNGRNFDRNALAEQDTVQPPSDTPPGEVDFGDFDPSAGFAGGGGLSFGGGSDVKLQYIDDDPDSYSNIFSSAKTNVSDADQARLITSLKTLSSYENLEDVLDMDAVLRYFVVHNFVVNGDSYTGNMIHNYYLYEEDGKLSMIPWDYNLAFGTFQAGSAVSAVNDPIDEVLSDRPMQAWIFSDESYAQRYHKLYAEFLSTVDAAQIINDAYALIEDYVEKDPTKFCTYEEFETGVQVLRSFCALRQESVRGQLEGTIPSTSEGQNAQQDTLVSADDLDLTDMGTMNNGGMGGGPGGFGGAGGREDRDGQMPPPAQDEAVEVQAAGNFPFQEQRDNRGFSPPDEQVSPASRQPAILLLGLSVVTLFVGLTIAVKYKRR